MENTPTNAAVGNENGLKDLKHKRALKEPLLSQESKTEWEGSETAGEEGRPEGFAL